MSSITANARTWTQRCDNTGAAVARLAGDLGRHCLRDDNCLLNWARFHVTMWFHEAR